MTKKQMAALAAAVLTAAAGLLTQCPDEPAPRQGTTVGADAGAR
jgi:hypothetical protein